MLCPKCNTIDDKVIDSRLSKDANSIRRRRECLTCEHRFTTYEVIERLETLVIKRDGCREAFDHHKIFSSFLKACEKRPIPLETIQKAVDAITQNFETTQAQEIPTPLIGNKVMEELRKIDPVAYVRYASVYRRFEEIGEFIEEIESLERSREGLTETQSTAS